VADPGASPVVEAVGRVHALAAIDCGTNSTRLLVAGPDGAPLVRLMRITRLGQGVDGSRRLAVDAITRTVAVLEEYRGVMDVHRVGRVRMTATSAARDAANRDDFFSAAEEAVGTRPELLAGAEEARLSFVGATAELDPADGPWLVADIGGGSTELAVGPAPGAGGGPDRLTPLAVRSLDVGCVRLTERFLAADPPGEDAIAAAMAHVEALLAEVSAAEPAFSAPAVLVGLAGTVAALASLDQRLGGYERDRFHHHVLTRSAVEGLLAELAALDLAGRRRRPGMEAERADVIVGGTVVLVALLRHFDIERCLTSEADILDGLIMTLLAGS
jgi:exopolyphosphatase/guanosine-5'-triphosphate,3'-diphosphate pyrophosphatase